MACPNRDDLGRHRFLWEQQLYCLCKEGGFAMDDWHIPLHSISMYLYLPEISLLTCAQSVFVVQTIPAARLAALPPAFTSDKPYATEYALALALLPPDDEDRNEAFRELHQDTFNRELLLNVEYRVSGFPHATLSVDGTTSQDIVKNLVADGILLVEKRRERKLAKLVSR